MKRKHRRAVSRFGIGFGLFTAMLALSALLPTEIREYPYNEFGASGVLAASLVLLISALMFVYACDAAIGACRSLFRQYPGFRIIVGREEIQSLLMETVQSATEFIILAGSRAKNRAYLNVIENHLEHDHNVEHVRIFFGKPKYMEGEQHLVALKSIRQHEEAVGADGTIRIGIYDPEPDASSKETERNFLLTEKIAIHILPSVNGIGNFDTALLCYKKDYISGWRKYADSLYAASHKKIRTKAQAQQIVSGNAP